MRIGLGCMRLSTDVDRDASRAEATIAEALRGSVVVFDTARAYGHDDGDLGHNERLLAGFLADKREDVRVITKCGMRRPNGAWVPDGRAHAIASDAEASRAAFGDVAIDVLLLHAPDPKTSLATSVRALARARDAGHARAIGLSNVNLAQLEEARRITDIAAIQVALGAFDDAAARGGLVRYCSEHGIELLAHTPLGGPKRARDLARDPLMSELARAVGASAAEIFLAYLLRVSDAIVPLVGARRPESVKSALHAQTLELDASALARLDQRFPGLARARIPPPRPTATVGEVVMVMGIAGAGKSQLARDYVAKNYVRLNRDTLGGTLSGLVQKLEARLESGERHFVLDNTYLTRAARSDVIAAAHRHGVAVRCVFVDTPMQQAQINVVSRMLDNYGTLLGPELLREKARRDPSVIAPTTLYRMQRELERPSLEEGFSEIDVVSFDRAENDGGACAVVAYHQLELIHELPNGIPCLVFVWRPDASEEWLRETRLSLERLGRRSVELGVCTHRAGPPRCWCRPPLPGLFLEFARRHGADPAKIQFLDRKGSRKII